MMNDGDLYDEDYFLRGKQSGKSLYEDYRWMPNLTIPMAQSIVNHCGITENARILDYGCARGYVVKALRGLGHDACGYDVSQWAIQNCDPQVKEHLTSIHTVAFNKDIHYDWILAKDVLEHVRYVKTAIIELMSVATKGVFAVVPLSDFDNGKYIIEEYEKDITHTQRWTLGTWVKMFLRPGWRVEAAYRVPGVKCNYAQYPRGNGFVTCRRIEE